MLTAACSTYGICLLTCLTLATVVRKTKRKLIGFQNTMPGHGLAMVAQGINAFEHGSRFRSGKAQFTPEAKAYGADEVLRQEGKLKKKAFGLEKLCLGTVVVAHISIVIMAFVTLMTRFPTGHWVGVLILCAPISLICTVLCVLQCIGFSTMMRVVRSR